MAGLWKLVTTNPKSLLISSSFQSKAPMKEFTTYPKKHKELLLMLKEDGSFVQQQEQQTDDGDGSTLSSSLKSKPTKLKRVVKGTWDFLDGQLILAADRPTTTAASSSSADGSDRSGGADTSSAAAASSSSSSTATSSSLLRDVILVGKVVATRQQSLADNPAIRAQNRTTSSVTEPTSETCSTSASGSSSSTAAVAVDTHLSVPQGSVKVGKFMYPKNHPSFFEQPIFRPTPTASFQLQQVLGSLNTAAAAASTAVPSDFERADFYDKRFLLTSHPIEYKPKGHLRWSIKYNKFVEDPPRNSNKRAAKAGKNDNTPSIPIRVMELAFYANNTFSTIAGLGDSTILRGKWDIIGKTRNQLWMQVWRFGFGRSVSGSVYSEGKTLTADDDKTYWGEISYMDEQPDGDEKKDSVSSIDSGSSSVNQNGTSATTSSNSINASVDDSVEDSNAARSGDDLTSSSCSDNHGDDAKSRRLQVKGSVMYGWGLEPQPVARFLMRETTVEQEGDDEEEDEDTTEEDLERTFSKSDEADEDDIDWSNAFQ